MSDPKSRRGAHRASGFPSPPGSHSAQGSLKLPSVSVLLTDFPFVSVSVSRHSSVSPSLWFSLVSQHPSLGSRAGGAGQWEQGPVLFSPRTMGSGKSWSQGLAQTPPPCLPWAHPSLLTPDMP